MLLHQVVGHIRRELHSRFGKPQCAVARAAAAVCTTSSAKFMDAEMLQLLEPVFGISVKESEIEMFKNYSRRRPSMEENSDVGLAEVFALCDKDIFPSVHNVLQLLLTVPQTSVTVERLFYSVKRINTRLRSLLVTTERLTSLAPLSNTVRERPCEIESVSSHISKNTRLL